MATKSYKIVICCVTRLRPKMLKEWLESSRFLAHPKNVVLEFVIVENNSEKTYQKLIDDEIARADGQRVFHYGLETKLGIASARNCAVNIALNAGADYIAFVDDDELMTRDWLLQIFEDGQAQGADLIGGPVRPLIERKGLSRFKKIVADGIAYRYFQVEKKNAKRLANNQAERITVVTNNWLCHKSVFTDHGLSFRDDLGFSGGEDTLFFKDTREKGCKTGWSAKAFVYETVPSDRISLSYQYNRGKTQALAHLRDKRRRKKGSDVLFTAKAIPFTFLRLLSTVLILLPASLFTGGVSIVSAVRNLGWCHGRTMEMIGAKSEFYKNVTGN